MVVQFTKLRPQSQKAKWVHLIMPNTDKQESEASAWLKIIVSVLLTGVIVWAGYLTLTLNAIGTTIQLIAANMATCDDVRILHESILKNHPSDSQFLAIQRRTGLITPRTSLVDRDDRWSYSEGGRSCSSLHKAHNPELSTGLK